MGVHHTGFAERVGSWKNASPASPKGELCRALAPRSRKLAQGTRTSRRTSGSFGLGLRDVRSLRAQNA